MLCHLASWACCHWTTHWHFVAFIQNIIHNISHTHTHTHLLTVSNTVGSVSSLVELAAKPRILLALQLFPLTPVNIACLLVALFSTIENFHSFFFFFWFPVCFSSRFLLSVAWMSACLQLAFMKQIRWRTVGLVSLNQWPAANRVRLRVHSRGPQKRCLEYLFIFFW